MDQIRQRVPFKFTESPEDNVLPAFLDEQEQEYVIETIKRENDQANVYNGWIARGVITLSVILQLTSLSKTNTPLAPMFPDIKPLSPIPLAPLWTIIDISCLMYIVASVPHRLHQSIPEVPRLPLLALTVLPPFMSLITGRDVPQTLWWTIAPATVLLGWFMQKSIEDSVKGIEALARLKYEVKGA